MLRFDPQVRIAYMSCPLVELFDAGALWSAQIGIDLIFLRIEDPRPARSRLRGFSLTVDCTTDGAAAEDLAQLHAWFTRVLPAPWSVRLAGDCVSAGWTSAPAGHLLARPAPADVPHDRRSRR